MKGLRQSLNSDIETIQLPPPYIGKYMHFRETVTKTLTSLVSNKHIHTFGGGGGGGLGGAYTQCEWILDVILTCGTVLLYTCI